MHKSTITSVAILTETRAINRKKDACTSFFVGKNNNNFSRRYKKRQPSNLKEEWQITECSITQKGTMNARNHPTPIFFSEFETYSLYTFYYLNRDPNVFRITHKRIPSVTVNQRRHIHTRQITGPGLFTFGVLSVLYAPRISW